MDTIEEAAEALRTYVHERERAKVLGTVTPDLGDLTEVADALDGLAMAEDDDGGDDFAEAFGGLRWVKMSGAERRRVIRWMQRAALNSGEGLPIEAAIEALNAICDTPVEPALE